MRTKSKFPKVVVNVRMQEETLKKVDKIAESKSMERSEFIRRIIDNYIQTNEAGL